MAPQNGNLADYQSKHHIGSHHVRARPWYLHMENSSRHLPRAQSWSTLKGCVGTLKDGYVCNVPLPRAPRIQSASHVTSHRAITCDGATPLNSTPLHSTSNEQVVMDARDTCYLQVPRVPTWSNLNRLLTGVRRNILPFCLLG